MYRPVCPLVSLYPSVFTLLANYSVLQTQMNINQGSERAEVFPSVIKQWFKVRVVKIWCCEFALRPCSRNTKRHLIWVIYGLRGSRGWLGLGPPTVRKTVGTPIRPSWKACAKFIKQFKRKSISVWRGQQNILHVYYTGTSLENMLIQLLWVLDLLH